ncbi:MAG: phosphoribosylamine--glycine ligase [Candidatus Shapirobacteria bacterium]
MRERNLENTVLVIDGGGRGAALVDKYAQSEHVGRVIAIPGNDSMKINDLKDIQVYPRLKTTDIAEILQICREEKVALVDVAQDNAIRAGLVNLLTENGIHTIGPTKEAGQIEWDKGWARTFGRQYRLPQPDYYIYSAEQASVEGAMIVLDRLQNRPWFIKAAYLAGGKGALPARNNEEAKGKILEISQTEPGKVFLVEEWLKGEDGTAGEEFSLFIACDGEHYRVLGSAQDHKRVNDSDQGENTGGMGCSSPPLVLTPEILREVKQNIIEKTIHGLRELGRHYKGILYLGGILVNKGVVPYPSFSRDYALKAFVVEFNARWGDPEAQVILPGLKTDLFELGMTVVEGNIGKVKIRHDGKSRVVVAGTSKDYPGDSSWHTGQRIFGIDEAREIDGVQIYGAGMKIIEDKYYSLGGRLFYIVGEGNNVVEARQKAYEAMSLVNVEGNYLHYRTDIGWRDVERLRK